MPEQTQRILLYYTQRQCLKEYTFCTNFGILGVKILHQIMHKTFITLREKNEPFERMKIISRLQISFN